MPVDPFVESMYFHTLHKLESVLEESKAEIVLMGTKPIYLSEKYKYILPDKQPKSFFSVKAIRKKTEEVDMY